MNNDLPYDFDLLYDVKDYEDVEAIARGSAHCSSASAQDLVDLFHSMDMEIPECLSYLRPTLVVTLYSDGTWDSGSEPAKALEARIVKVTAFKETK